MRQIETKSDVLVNKNILNRVSYVPGGVSLAISNLVAGRVIQEAAVLGEPSSGVRSVLKAAPILTGSTTTAIKVSTALNQFKVGDFLTAKESGKAYAITEIDSTDGVDTLTVGTAIDADVDGWIYEAVEEAETDTSVIKGTPDVVLETAFEVPATTQVYVSNDALMRADVREGSVAPIHLSKLALIGEVKY